MKKLVTAGIVASTLLLTNASADTKWYAGLEVGSRDAEGLNESSILSVGLAIGAGLDFKVNESISLLGGIDFGYRKYQDIEVTSGWSSYTVETSETYQKLYIGANYRF